MPLGSMRSHFCHPLVLYLGSSDHGHVMIVEAILLAAQPALAEILTPDELARTRVDVVTTEDEPVMPSVILRENLLLRVVVHDEQIRIQSRGEQESTSRPPTGLWDGHLITGYECTCSLTTFWKSRMAFAS